MRLASLLLVVLCGCLQVADARICKLTFLPEYKGKVLVWQSADSSCTLSPDLQLETFRCYISGIRLLSGGQEIWAERGSYHLIDAASHRLDIQLELPDDLHYDQLQCHLGIDSQTNAGGAQGGDLDATKGMYWAWQSGYINFKMEGFSPQCPTRKHAFQFHLGGFLEGNACAQPLSFAVAPSAMICIGVATDRFFDGLQLQETHTVMSPGAPAKRLSALAATMFYLSRTK